jgi:hypothetical protein
LFITSFWQVCPSVFKERELEIVVLGERFENGTWKHWKHKCDEDEVAAVADSAFARSMDLALIANAKGVDPAKMGAPFYIDYLQGAQYVFDVSQGSTHKPADGGTNVYGVIVGHIIIALLDRHQLYLELSESHI